MRDGGRVLEVAATVCLPKLRGALCCFSFSYLRIANVLLLSK